MNRRTTTVTLVGLLALTASGCGGDSEPTDANKATNQLEVVSWWTSGSERQALDTLLGKFRSSSPGVQATNAAVAGGAGSEAIVQLSKRLQEGNPPDVWQTFAGEAVQGYAARGDVRSVAPVADKGRLRERMNPAVWAALLHDGQPYGIPTGAHRGNTLFFNRSVLAKAGVAPPTAATTPAQLIAAMQKVKASGTNPLCLGGKDRFTKVELFENVLLATVGPQVFKDIADNEFDWRGPKAKAALRTFGDLLKQADPQADSQTWDQAIRKLGSGGCAFASMNDSGYGELVASGAQPGQDFGAVAFPGTSNSFIAVVDVFVAGSKAKNPKNALTFLEGISDVPTQVGFSKAKGSIPVLKDVPVSSLSPYQQEASKAFWSSPVLLSLTHGEAVDPQIQLGLFTAVQTYARTGDSGAFATDLEQAAARRGGVPPR